MVKEFNNNIKKDRDILKDDEIENKSQYQKKKLPRKVIYIGNERNSSLNKKNIEVKDLPKKEIKAKILPRTIVMVGDLPEKRIKVEDLSEKKK